MSSNPNMPNPAQPAIPRPGGSSVTQSPNSLPAAAALTASEPSSLPSSALSAFNATGSFPANMTFYDPKDANVGSLFGGKYLVERKLGEGGMGVVYLARHKAIGKRVAIKVLHSDAMKDPDVVERFVTEAQAATQIGNEHIIDITDFSELPNGQTYFVMEYLDGKPLSQLFSELKGVPVPRLARIAKQLCHGLAAAHQAGIIHRDLKPDNIFLCKRSGGETDFVKILDFGIAKVNLATSKITKAGAVFGTPHYMSPEQASGLAVDHRTDIYALGVMLYEGSVGRVPFDADNFMGILTQHMYKAPVPPRAVAEAPADLSPGMEVIIMRCLRKKPEERYQTMEELLEDIERLLNGEVPKAAHEMMALSASYQSLAQSAIAASVPNALPGARKKGASRSLLPIVAGVAAVCAVVAIAVGALMGPSKTSAGSKHGDAPSAGPEASSARVEPVATVPSVSAVPSVSVVPSVVKKTHLVLISSKAAGARVFSGDKELGEEPLNYELEVGTSQTLTVRAPGYVDKTVTINDQSPAKLSVELKRVAGTAPAPKRRGGGEIDDPWR